MGVNKKPAVIAKTARKVRISATEAAFAKSQGMSIEELAKSKLPKRGRPVGSKNKPKVEDRDLVDKLQEALAIEMKTVEGMEKLFEEFKSVSRKVSDLTFWQRIKLVLTGSY
jgi:hypothetical protein